MESNSNRLMSFSGFNACNDNLDASFQNIFNKTIGNKKQINEYDVNDFSETNESLLKTLNVLDVNIQNGVTSKQDTYTLDDLLDFGNEGVQQSEFFNALIEDEPTFQQDGIFMETALPSPVSSSSDESCDLDEILFMEEPSNSSSESAHDLSFSFEQTPSNVAQSPGNLENIVNDTDLSALCSLLFQNASSTVTCEQNISSQMSFSPAPSSPSTSISSESDVEKTSENYSPRYKPYSKKKQKTPEQKQRKMAQNRTAATRYRVKKKDEFKVMSEEADKLEEKNKDLRGKVDGLKNEIDYLKNLMLDVIKARLTKGASPESLLQDAASKLLN